MMFRWTEVVGQVLAVSRGSGVGERVGEGVTGAASWKQGVQELVCLVKTMTLGLGTVHTLVQVGLLTWDQNAWFVECCYKYACGQVGDFDG